MTVNRRSRWLAAHVLRPHSKTTKLIGTVDMTAFAGVMFALVAMFLALATVDHSPRDAAHIAVDLPESTKSTEMAGSLREDALLVAVRRDGRIWFDKDQITPEHLPAAIRERVSHGAERKVYIRADMRVNYGRVLEVLSSVRSAGIDNVAFLVNERNSRPAR
jgi:biopolymer transport protein TolR